MVAIQHRPSTMDSIRRQVEFRAKVRKIRSGQRQVQHLVAVSKERAK
jgi:hypothetical protein